CLLSVCVERSLFVNMTLTFSARRITWILGGIAVYLSLQSILLKHLEWAVGTDSTYWLYNLVEICNSNREESIPTWYAVVLLLVCAVLLFIIARAKRHSNERYSGRWFVLGLIVLYLSIDEGAAIHEIFSTPVEELLQPTGYLSFGWIWIGVPLLIVFVLAYLKFFWHLPAQTRRLFLLAGILYVTGAVVIESISANQWYLDGDASLTYSTISMIEELFEMLGVVVFIYALHTDISQTIAKMELVVTSLRQPE
ncbi:MAG: hypothetical protein K8I82_23170, partial [Anaerolineae bacterium]|nr:hypothetical protein [Anaerolineae bacterium]